MKSIKLPLVLSVVFAMLLLACGGGGDQPAAESKPAPESKPAAQMTPTGSATVAGSINFAGTAPKPKRLRMDAECSGFHDGPTLSESVVVNANNTVKNVFVYVKEGLEGKSFSVPSEPAVMDQVGCAYTPHVLGVQTGQTIKILNSDPLLHNINAQAKTNRPFNFGMPKKGDEREKSFRKQEVMVKVKCDVHPWMAAYIGVVDHPFFAVSGDDGSFSINNLPAGDYTLEAWHETFGTQTMKVTVADGGSATADFSFGG